MKRYSLCLLLLCTILLVECKNDNTMKDTSNAKILFLHHSTGKNVLRGNYNKVWYKITKRGAVTKLFAKHNSENKTNYQFNEQSFPKWEPYGWKNYPYDYYNIWVKNAGNTAFMEEPTLEMLTKSYDVIIWKHCFPVSDIKESLGEGDIDSKEKTLANYQLQYNALKAKMHEFPNTKFIVWTPPALVKNGAPDDMAKRANIFSDWVINEWNEENDNIFIWDFRTLETDGGLYLKPEYANSNVDPHPNQSFSAKVAKLFVNRIVDVVENNGKNTLLTGEMATVAINE